MRRIILAVGLLLLAGCHKPEQTYVTASDNALARENARPNKRIVRGGIDLLHGHNWRVVTRVDKYRGNVTGRQIAMGTAPKPYETLYAEGNVLCTAGITRLGNRLIGTGSTTAYDAADTRIGFGDGTTAVAAGDTDLSAAAGATHRFFALVDQTPTVSTNVITWHATVGTADGNFHWQEFGVDNGTANGTTVVAPLLSHKLTDFGTKTSAGSWACTLTLTISTMPPFGLRWILGIAGTWRRRRRALTIS